MTPKQRVLRKYPKAFWVSQHIPGWHYILDGAKNARISGLHQTAIGAWLDAARRLRDR